MTQPPIFECISGSALTTQNIQNNDKFRQRLHASDRTPRSSKMRYIYTGGQVIPKQCKYGPRPAEGLVLGDLEWWSVTDHLVKEQRERETAAVHRAKEDAKKEVSFQMTKNWSNTLASVKTLSEQKRVEKREKEKQDKIDQYNEIMKNRKEEKKHIMEEMKKVLAENKESSKLIKSGVFLSMVIQERGKQIAMKKALADEENRKNMELGKKLKAEAEEYEREKLNEKIKEKMKKKRQKEDLDTQLSGALRMVDINKRKKDADEELGREKQDLINMRIEEEKIRYCNGVEKNYRKEFAAMYVKKSQYQIEHDHKMRLEQEEEDEINNIYIIYEKRFQKERKEKEKGVLKNKVEEREKASLKLAEKLRELSQKEEERLDAAVREKAALAERGSEEILRRKAAAIAVVLEEKKKSDEAEARKRHEDREGVKWDVIQACRTAEVNEEWRANLRARARDLMNDMRSVYDEQCRQRTEILARQARDLENFEEDLAASHEEDDKYGQRALDFVTNHDMSTYPVLAAIARVKQMNGTWRSSGDENLKNQAKDHETSDRKSKQELLGSGCYCFKC